MKQDDIKYLKPLDFDQSWEIWFQEVKNIPNQVKINSINKTEYGSLVSFYFDSVQNTKVYARLYVSDLSLELNRPLVIFFHGAGGKSSDDYYINKSLYWVNNGFSVLMMDCRNQGGLTIDSNVYAHMDRTYQSNGITDKNTVYDKLLYQDALKLLMLTRDQKIKLFNQFYDKDIIVTGNSQGGQMALAVASLSDVPILCLPDIPSGCAIVSRIERRLGKYTPYDDLIQKHSELKDLIYENVSYTDLINLVDKIKCPVFSSVGTKDEICPMEFYLKAHNQIRTEKEVIYYEGYGHGGFDKFHFPKKMEFVLKHIIPK